jgi:hypothetical protein
MLMKNADFQPACLSPRFVDFAQFGNGVLKNLYSKMKKMQGQDGQLPGAKVVRKAGTVRLCDNCS